MLKIYPLDYYRLTNASHFELMLVIEETLAAHPIVNESFPRAVSLFLAAFENEKQAMRHIDRPMQSAKIHDAETERIYYFRMLRDTAKLMQRKKNEEISAAAALIVEISDTCGGSGIYSQAADERTVDIQTFVEHLEKEYSNQVAMLGIQPQVEHLKEANHQFMEFQMDRTWSDAEYGLNATKRARRSCDFALKTLLSLVQDKIRLGEGEEFTNFVKVLNVEINKHRIELGQGPGGRPPRHHAKEET